jgi:hypothetical protein
MFLLENANTFYRKGDTSARAEQVKIASEKQVDLVKLIVA